MRFRAGVGAMNRIARQRFGVRQPSAAFELSHIAKQAGPIRNRQSLPKAAKGSAPYTQFGPAARCSAGFQPAVSQGFQPAGLPNLPTRPEPPPALPIGNRRPAPKAFGVHRLETCATSAREMRVRFRSPAAFLST